MKDPSGAQDPIFLLLCDSFRLVDVGAFSDDRTGLSFFRITVSSNKSVVSMYLREIGWDGVDWVGMAQDKDQWRALVNMVLNFRVP
jgi:hypothetical protein